MRSPLDQLRLEVEKALKGRSVAGEATRAGLPRDAFRRVLQGHDPRLTNAADICDALGLELYIGPPRDAAPSPIEMLVQPAGEGAGDRAGGVPLDIARMIQRTAGDFVRVALGLGRNPIPPDLWPVLAVHFGEELPPGNQKLRAEGSPVEVIEFEAAAGDGTQAIYEERKGLVWFRRGWLERRGLSADDCIVIGVRGDSMEPTLPDGCSVLVDRASTEWKPPRLFVLRTDDGLVVKRAAVAEDGSPIMESDNPYWPSAPIPEGADVVGCVRWTARAID